MSVKYHNVFYVCSPHLPAARNLPIKHHGDRTFGAAQRGDSFASSTDSDIQTATPLAVSLSLQEVETAAKTTTLKKAESSEATNSRQGRSKTSTTVQKPALPSNSAETATLSAMRRFSAKQLDKASSDSNRKRKRQNAPATVTAGRADARKERLEKSKEDEGADNKQQQQQQQQEQPQGQEQQQQQLQREHPQQQPDNLEHEEVAKAEKLVSSSSRSVDDFGEKTTTKESATSANRLLRPTSYQLIASPVNTYQTTGWDKEESKGQKKSMEKQEKDSKKQGKEEKREGREERRISAER